jgi:2-polyprenyl-6-hydroxyphenyl methylase / 3-demethylubiquinone-9 3-methyltransferase
MSQDTLNYSQDEIQKFDKLADDWWDPQGPMKPLHLLNPLRLSYIEKHAHIENCDVLDVGCGAGLLSEAMATKGARVKAIDLSESALGAAREHAAFNNQDIDYQNIAIEQLSTSEQRFDVITCMEMLEHVPDPLAIIQHCTALLKPSGTLFLSTINRNPKSYAFSIIGAEYLLRMLPIGTHDYKQFIRPSELSRWCRISGLQLQDLQGVNYKPLSGNFELSTNVSVNYMAAFTKNIL